jgi:hypothetical protein
VWQALYEELHDQGLTIVTVASERDPEDARAWIEAAAPTHPSLVDTTWLVSDLYHIENVPTTYWIDEGGRIVRPQDVAFGTNDFQEFTGIDAHVHQQALRDWVTGARPALDARAVARHQRVPSDGDQQARAEFGLGRWLWANGRADTAKAHFDRAEELAPKLWMAWRGSMRMYGEDPMGELFMTKMTSFIETYGSLNQALDESASPTTP